MTPLQVSILALIVSTLSAAASIWMSVRIFRYNKRQKKMERWVLLRERYIETKMLSSKLQSLWNSFDKPILDALPEFVVIANRIYLKINELEITIKNENYKDMSEEQIESLSIEMKSICEHVRSSVDGLENNLKSLRSK